MMPTALSHALSHHDLPAARATGPGGALVLRVLEPDDGHLVQEVFDHLSPRSRERRFLAPKPVLTRSDLRQLLAIDHHDHEALVALRPEGRPVGIARFVRDRDRPDTAEVAVAVVDAWQGRGVGTLLATDLSERAREVAVTRFSMMMAHDNEAAVRLLHRAAGEIERVGWDAGVVEFLVSLAPRRTTRSRRALLKAV